jgi:Response regulators consisting of a CheY-like receiver domain and a winged-helix DNA-binding domain
MKILVIEDDRTVGQYVKRGLEEQQYHADLVGDGMEGCGSPPAGSTTCSCSICASRG